MWSCCCHGVTAHTVLHVYVLLEAACKNCELSFEYCAITVLPSYMQALQLSLIRAAPLPAQGRSKVQS